MWRLNLNHQQLVTTGTYPLFNYMYDEAMQVMSAYSPHQHELINITSKFSNFIILATYLNSQFYNAIIIYKYFKHQQTNIECLIV